PQHDRRLHRLHHLSHLLRALSFAAGLLSGTGPDQVQRRGDSPTRLFLHPDFAHAPGGHHRSLCHHYATARVERELRQAPPDCPLDISAPALCFGNGCHSLFNVVSTLSFALSKWTVVRTGLLPH